MGTRSGGAGRSTGGSMARTLGLKPNATDGTERTIAGKKQNTADVINQAISMGGELDLAKAKQYLGYNGWTNPSPQQIQRYAAEERLLTNIERLTGANARGQHGKWDMSSAQSIHKEFNSYLNRRIQGQRSRWTARKKGY